MPESLTARQLLRHVKPLKLPERLINEPAETAIFADHDMREALTRRVGALAGRLLPLEALSGGKFTGDRVVICTLSGGTGVRMDLSDERPDIPIRVLTDDYLLAVAAGLDPWVDLAELEARPLADQRYAIVCLPRSGSTFFCHLLQGLNNVARPTEHLRPHILFLAEHRQETGFDAGRWMRLVMRDADKDGRFGTKVIADFAVSLWPHLDDSQRQMLESDWAGAKLIHVERQDKVAQAVSQFIADETRIWHVRHPGDEAAYSEAKRNVIYDGDRIASLYRKFLNDEARLSAWLEDRGGSLHRVTYEALVSDPQRIVSEAVAFIRGEPADPVALAHERYFPMSDAVNKVFSERFRRQLDDVVVS